MEIEELLKRTAEYIAYAETFRYDDFQIPEAVQRIFRIPEKNVLWFFGPYCIFYEIRRWSSGVYGCDEELLESGIYSDIGEFKSLKNKTWEEIVKAFNQMGYEVQVISTARGTHTIGTSTCDSQYHSSGCGNTATLILFRLEKRKREMV